MAKGKKSKGRRAYLNDFQKTTGGGYVYNGKLHYYRTEGITRRQALIRLWLLAAAMAVSSVVCGCVPAAGMRNTFYVLLPYTGTLLSSLSVVWLLCRLSAGGDPLRHYIYTATVKQMCLRGNLVMIFSALTLAGETVCLVRQGVEDFFPGTLAFLLAQAICLIAALMWEKFEKKLQWSEEPEAEMHL